METSWYVERFIHYTLYTKCLESVIRLLMVSFQVLSELRGISDGYHCLANLHTAINHELCFWTIPDHAEALDALEAQAEQLAPLLSLSARLALELRLSQLLQRKTELTKVMFKYLTCTYVWICIYALLRVEPRRPRSEQDKLYGKLDNSESDMKREKALSKKHGRILFATRYSLTCEIWQQRSNIL